MNRHFVWCLIGWAQLNGTTSNRVARLNKVVKKICGTPFWLDPIDGSEPDPGCPAEAINQIHFINASVFILKPLQKRFQFGQAYKHLQIQNAVYNIICTFQCGKPINIAFIQKYNFHKGISSLFKMIYNIDVQGSNCFYKTSMFKRNGVNAYDGAYSVNFLNDSELLNLRSAFNHYQSLCTWALIKKKKKKYSKHFHA